MPAYPITFMEKTAPGTNRDGLDFFWTTAPSPGKDSDHDYVLQLAVPFTSNSAATAGSSAPVLQGYFLRKCLRS